jgi:hypothetical protein
LRGKTEFSRDLPKLPRWKIRLIPSDAHSTVLFSAHQSRTRSPLRLELCLDV